MKNTLLLHSLDFSEATSLCLFTGLVIIVATALHQRLRPLPLESSDEDLWKELRKGDIESLKEIYIRNYTALFNYGIRITKEEYLVEDCIQNIFCHISTNARHLGEAHNVRCYLISSLRREILKSLKEERLFSNLDSTIDFTLSPEQSLISNETYTLQITHLKQSIDHLSSKQQEAIYLKFYQRLSYEEISEILDINYQSSRSLIYKAIKALKKYFLNV